MFPTRIGYIGLGHIGGSIAKTVHRLFPDTFQIACDPDPDTIASALREGVISEGYDRLNDAFAACQLVLLCAPVLKNSEYISHLLNIIHEDMTLSDIGSVKTGIHEQVAKYPDLERCFVGGHPMCGTEHTGYEYSADYMLENAYYILTPSDTVPQEKTDAMYAFAQSIGALPMVMDYRKHDHVVGSVSHLPHVISATLVNLVSRLDDENQTMRTVAAGGFKDITRISSSSPDMWENICLANRDEILRLVDTYVASIQQIRERIAASDGSGIHSFFSSAKNYRDSINVSGQGSVHPIYQLFCDLIDEAGGIATIATILASNNISIKNIGIIHNREFEQGVLQVEFYQKEAFENARDLLKKYHYTVYER